MPMISPIEQLQNFIFTRKFHPLTNLVYDVPHDGKGSFGVRLPFPSEIRRQYPNPCGWNTGMEDSMISGGSVLDALCEKYKQTKDRSIHALSEKIFCGIKNCASISGVHGFLARSISPIDGKSFYFNSSRDQYTHIIFALCNYYDCGLATEEEKSEIADILVSFAEYIERCVIPENDYSLLRADGKMSMVCKMINVDMHEWARLPMFYLAAYHVSKDEHWYALYLQYVDVALEKSKADVNYNWWHFHALIQAQLSFRLIYNYEADENRRQKCLALMADYVSLAEAKDSELLFRQIQNGSLHPCLPQPDWRVLNTFRNETVGGYLYAVPDKNSYDEEAFWSLADFAGGIVVKHLHPNTPPSSEDQAKIDTLLQTIDIFSYESRGEFYVYYAYYLAGSQN